MDEIDHRLRKLEEGMRWLLVRQLRQEAKLLALIEELIAALERTGKPADSFRQRLRDLEGKNALDLLKQFGKSQEGGEIPPPDML